MHPSLIDFISLAHREGMRVSLATNGIALSDCDFIQRLSTAYRPADTIGISFKGSSKFDYKNISLSSSLDSFELLVKGIMNLAAVSSLRYTVSYVVSKSNIGKLGEVLGVIRGLTSAPIGLSLCGPYAENGIIVNPASLKSFCDLMNRCIDVLDEIDYSDIYLHANVPLCNIDANSLLKASDSKTVNLTYGCHVLHRSGLVFDTNGDLLLCNHLPGMSVGRMGVDYLTEKEFLSFLSSEAFTAPWESLVKLPYDECAECEQLFKCLGGCPLFHY